MYDQSNVIFNGNNRIYTELKLINYEAMPKFARCTAQRSTFHTVLKR